jgi:hypothetical protein
VAEPTSFDDLVGESQCAIRHGKTQSPGRFQVDYKKSNLLDCKTGKPAGGSPRRMRPA